MKEKKRAFDTLKTDIVERRMEYLFNSKLIAYCGIATAGLIGIDTKLMNGTILEGLNISPFFTHLYLIMFTVYYIMKMYWYWQDKSLDKKERLKRLNK